MKNPDENIKVESIKSIDLSPGGLVFSGRKKGKAARKKYDLDSIDRNGEFVEITIPDNAYTVTSSFILGLLGESIKHWRERSEFLKHYKFILPDHFRPTLDYCIDQALSPNRPLLSINENKRKKGFI